MSETLRVAASPEHVWISAHDNALEYRRDNAQMLLEDLMEVVDFTPEDPHLLFADMQWTPTISLRADHMLDPGSQNTIRLSREEAERLADMLHEALEDDL